MTVISLRPEWIVFDAVYTLIVPDPPVATAYYEIGRRFGSRLTEGEVHTRFHSAFAGFDETELNGADPDCPGSLTTSEQHEERRWRTIVTEVFDDVTDVEGCFHELFVHFGRPEAWAFFPDAESALATLSEQGFHLGIASNFDERLHSILDAHTVGRLLNLRAVSSTIGYRKPSRHFFRAVQNLADCTAERILFVGDDWANDVQPARAAGMQALQIDRGRSETGADRLADLRDLIELLEPPCPTG